MWFLRIGSKAISSIFISVFHRILDFKSGAEFLFGPFSFLAPCSAYFFKGFKE